MRDNIALLLGEFLDPVRVHFDDDDISGALLLNKLDWLFDVVHEFFLEALNCKLNVVITTAQILKTVKLTEFLHLTGVVMFLEHQWARHCLLAHPVHRLKHLDDVAGQNIDALVTYLTYRA